jgi:hypothetical protein
VQDAFGFGCERNVRALGHKLYFQACYVVFA